MVYNVTEANYMNVRIIVDSSADIAEEIRERFSIIPLKVNFGEDEYIDGVTISHKEFYEKLIECGDIPVTSQASPAAFADEFEKCRQRGEEAVVIAVSSKLSGTYQSANIAAEDFDNVYVVDGKSVAIGTGILAEYALSLADSGMSAREIAEEISRERENVCVIAMLDTLEYLRKGGRISKTAAVAGSILAIKPVIAVVDGAIEILGKARGSKQGNNLLIKMIEESGGVDFERPLLLGYTGITDALLQKYIEDSRALWGENVDKLRSEIIGSAIGTHAGPGAVAAAFFKARK